MTKEQIKLIEDLDLEAQTQEAIQEVLQEWLGAVREFAQWKYQLYSIIEAYNFTPAHGLAARDLYVASALKNLYSEMAASLEALIIEIGHMDDNNEPPWQKLRVHAATIHQWSYRIKVALSGDASVIA